MYYVKFVKNKVITFTQYLLFYSNFRISFVITPYGILGKINKLVNYDNNDTNNYNNNNSNIFLFC